MRVDCGHLLFSEKSVFASVLSLLLNRPLSAVVAAVDINGGDVDLPGCGPGLGSRYPEVQRCGVRSAGFGVRGAGFHPTAVVHPVRYRRIWLKSETSMDFKWKRGFFTPIGYLPAYPPTHCNSTYLNQIYPT
ncbi:hypothetical protein QBC41DRAFT_329850 [Cercophora samala]|uniref:Uncharacterized protein n=1 Tax=Cercophora samala TaxID=330535 RepID=A0AA39Z0W1_9PEZI|nr:hypothetical protein QBC41DRAFT_329850 [Cercophora samala]